LKTEVNVGIIGTGSMGAIHLSNCVRLKTTKVIAVADISKGALSHAKKLGVKNLYNNYEDLLKDETVDAVIISLPTFLHAEAAIKSAEAGKDILLEKPMTRDVAEAEQVVSAVKSSGVKFMVGYPIRFTESFANQKKEIDSGKLGHIQIAVANHISTGPFFARNSGDAPQPVPSWWFNKKLTGGGALIDLGCHIIDLLIWYFGEVEDIKGYMGHRFNMDFEDHAACVLKFKNGTVGTVNAGWFSTSHCVQADLFGTVKHSLASSKSASVLDYVRNVLGKAPSTTFSKELEYFANCILTNVQPEPSVEEGLHVQKLIAKAYDNPFSFEELNLGCVTR
jgi:predicted dehydrogenase